MQASKMTWGRPQIFDNIITKNDTKMFFFNDWVEDNSYYCKGAGGRLSRLE